MDSNPNRSFVKVDHQQNHRFDEEKGTKPYEKPG
jgi:hypothetical protein